MTTSTTTQPGAPSTLDGLPKQFVQAMRTLFDIMDDKRTGHVDLVDIEHRWQDDGAKGLPKGVIESLRKVTPANGLLTFERFCAGLKICLLRNQCERREKTAGAVRPPSAPLLDVDGPKAVWGIRPQPIMPQPQPPQPQQQQRALSMPQLVPSSEQQRKDVVDVAKLYGPPKPPRTALALDRAEIRTALQNWQMGVMMNDQEGKNAAAAAADPKRFALRGRAPADGKPNEMYAKKPNARRREPRRHTLQNGIDYNMLKRMKQIEQEKDILMQGLNAVEKARDWYLKQVAIVQEKMKYLGRMGHVEPWSETQQERLELQRARVLEVNRHLAALTDSWERGGLPLHMNLAVHHYPQPHDMTSRLKQQNRLLTEEVGKKSDRISVLEREKASLIQMLQIRSQPNRNSGQEEAVF